MAPSQEIYRAILRAKKDKKVVCSMGTVAASGGFYMASACDKIYASPGTITGSIGVISEFPHVQGLLSLAHVEVDTIKSGPLKDSGSPLARDDRRRAQVLPDSSSTASTSSSSTTWPRRASSPRRRCARSPTGAS